MTAPLSRQIEALKTIELRVKPFHLVKSGAVVREAEAKFLLEMIADARHTLESFEDIVP